MPSHAQHTRFATLLKHGFDCCGYGSFPVQVNTLLGEMVKAADTNKDGMIDEDELEKLLANPDIFKQASAAVAKKGAADTRNDKYFADTQKEKPRGSVAWSRSLYDGVATAAVFLSSKLGREPHPVDTLADMLNRGAYTLGVGTTKKDLVKLGFDPENLVLGAGAVIHDSRLGTPLFFAFLFFCCSVSWIWFLFVLDRFVPFNLVFGSRFLFIHF